MSSSRRGAASNAWHGTSKKIDQSTQDFLKVLEETTGTKRTKAVPPPASIQGGLPPHLLRQKQGEMAPASARNVSGATAGGSSGFGQYYGGSYPASSPQQEQQFHSQEQQSRPREQQPRSRHQSPRHQSQEQQSRPREQQPSSHHQSPRHQSQEQQSRSWEQQPSSRHQPQEQFYGQSYVQSQPPVEAQRQADHDAYRDRKALVPFYTTQRHTTEVGRSLKDSRWAPSPQNSTMARPQAKKVDLPKEAQTANNFRVSARYYGDWEPSPDYRNTPEHATSTELGKATEAWDVADQKQQQVTSTDLVAVPERKQWRPKHSWDLSDQDLPESCKGSLHFDDDASIRNFDGDSYIHGPDIRGTVGGELDLVPKVHSKGFYNKNMWNEYPEDPEDPHDRKWRPTYCQQWAKDMEEFTWPKANWLHITDIQHELCDVQTSSGWLMAPVEYPETHINPEDIMKASDGARARRNDSSANLKIKTDYEKNKRRIDAREAEVLWENGSSPAQSVASLTPLYQAGANHDRREIATKRRVQGIKDGAQPQSSPGPTAQPTPPPTQTIVARRPPTFIPGKTVWHPNFGQVYHQPKVIEHTDPPTYLKIACFLRPAKEGDLTQILKIYNWEVAHGMQALDTRALEINNMKRIFSQCEQSRTPMIVMVAGRASEAIAREKVAQDHQDQRRASLQQSAVTGDKVIGFAYVSIMETGLDGDAHHNVGRFLGQVHIYVANDSRRKGVGRALLQKTLTLCSRHAIIREDNYEWHEPERTARYDNAYYNSRSYSRLFIKLASRGKDDPEQKWITNFLDTENFICVSTMDKSRKIGYGGNGEVVDTIIYQHDCQDTQTMNESDPTRK